MYRGGGFWSDHRRDLVNFIQILLNIEKVLKFSFFISVLIHRVELERTHFHKINNTRKTFILRSKATQPQKIKMKFGSKDPATRNLWRVFNNINNIWVISSIIQVNCNSSILSKVILRLSLDTRILIIQVNC